MGDELVAMTEGDKQRRIDAQSLRARGTVEYAHDELAGSVMGAHPHFDHVRGQMLNVATKFGLDGVVSLYEHAFAQRQRQRKIVCSWRTARVPYLHSFGLTPAHAVLVAHPLLVEPLHMLWSNRGFIDHFRWRPEEGTRLVVMNRATGALQQYEAAPLFVFHTVNASEVGHDTVLDVLAYPNAEIMGALRVERLIERLPDLRPSLLRMVLRPGRARAELETLSDVGFEFPSTNYRNVNGREYRFVWGAADGPQPDGTYASSIVKLPTGRDRASTLRSSSGRSRFVARASASRSPPIFPKWASIRSAASSCFAIYRAPYVGGLLTTNTLTSRAAFGGDSDPPGYTQASIATIRLWKGKSKRR